MFLTILIGAVVAMVLSLAVKSSVTQEEKEVYRLIEKSTCFADMIKAEQAIDEFELKYNYPDRVLLMRLKWEIKKDHLKGALKRALNKNYHLN